MRISVCVPAYNEEASLGAAIKGLAAALGGHGFESAQIIIVDDGSTDRTGEIAEQLAREFPDLVQTVRHETNSGYGAGYRTGLGLAVNPWYALAPADGQFNPCDLGAMAAAADRADLVLGTRTRRADPFYRKLNTAVFRLVTRLFFGLPYSDVNWVKLGRTELLRSLGLESHGIGIDTELVAKAHGRGWRIVEVETRYLPRAGGEDFGSSPARVLRTVIELWRLRPRLARARTGGGDQ